jgi:CheY-like chemotaxis protein
MNRIVLYEEARCRTYGSPGRSPAWLHSPSVTQYAVSVPHGTSMPRALVVDDEPTIRSAIARYLRRRGWDADEAVDGQAALVKLQGVSLGGYQIVISDLRMPNYSGDQLHDWLADHRPDLFVRLILTTGDLGSPILGDFIARTPRPVLEKPFELVELAQLVDAVLSAAEH